MTSNCRAAAAAVAPLLVSIALMAMGCAGPPTGPSGPPTPLTLSLQSSAWQTIGDPDPFPLTTTDSAQLEFEFPTSGSINYIHTPSALAVLRGTLVVSIRVMTTGPVVFNSLDPIAGSCSIPASVRPFIWANDNGNGPYDRWWSNPRSFPLAAGSTTISVPLLPEFWSSVNGQFGNADTPAEFRFEKARLNVTRLGLTFGGGCSFGHGINVRGGSAQFQLTEFAIR